MGLARRQVVVTGAGRGIGRAVALGLAQSGAKVIAVARTRADLDELERASGSITGWCEDVTTEAFYERLESLNALDILVNNAGMNRPMPFDMVDAKTLELMLSLNVRAVFRTSQAAARVMLKNQQTAGSIIHMSSQMGHVGASQRTVYCMTKHAVEGLTKAMAVELALSGIRVNSIAPTFVETDLTRAMLADPAFRTSVLNNIPLGRLATSEDILGAVLFLASDAAAMITGHSLKVDGGWTAH